MYFLCLFFLEPKEIQEETAYDQKYPEIRERKLAELFMHLFIL